MFVYQPGDSLLHRSDAVSKGVWLIAITVTAVCLTNVWAVIGLLVLVGATVTVLGRIGPLRLLRRLWPFLITGAWLFGFLTLTSNRAAPELASWGPFTVTQTSLAYGAALGLRIVVLGVASTGFVLTTEPRRLVNDLVHYGRLPYRGGFAIYAALRFIPQLQSEARTIRHAHAVRAANGTGPFRTLLELQRLTVPLLAGAIRRVQLTAVAMDSRAFGAFTTRTALDVQPRHPVGIAIAVLQIAVAIVAIVLLVVGGDSAGLPARVGGG